MTPYEFLGLFAGVVAGALAVWFRAYHIGWRRGFEDHRVLVKKVWPRGAVVTAIEEELRQEAHEKGAGR